jgi:peptidoglycan/LPS O-acetylase OafA/YrhL
MLMLLHLGSWLMARRLDIQAYRAMAIASVLLFHADPEIFPNGYLGVDLFFVISGFVMAPQIIELSGLKTSDRFQNFFKFIKRRFFRLYPALAAICLISIPLVFLFGVFQDFSRSVNQAAFTFFLAGNHGAEFFSG